MDVAAKARKARTKARGSDTSDWMDHAVRVGLISYGVVHLLIAWLALRLAFGDGGGNASSQGALKQLAGSTLGQVSLYVVAVGFLALVAWQLLEAIWGHQDEDGGKRTFKRAVSVGKVVLYASLALSAFKTASGSQSGSGGTDGMTSKLMGMPGGPLLVGALGLGIVVVAGFLAHRGWTEKFRTKLDGSGQSGKDGSTYVVFGKIGYLAKGIALTIVGGLFLYAAFTHNPDKSAGLDQALKQVLEQPFGAPMLAALALGFGSYGLFCFAWAKHLDR